mmetsp:Transcript_13940/g.29369  ORF Transcript_13940/g.29369 Transcript_13940/m.29369 type:complete len:472 (+) Transcript_13940:89-1504(+)
MRSFSVFFAIRAASSIGGGTFSSAFALRSASIVTSTSSSNSIISTSRTTSRTMTSSSSSSAEAASGTSAMSRDEKARLITGLPLGPYSVGVTTVQIDGDPKRGRGLQTEIWYPCDVERTSTATGTTTVTKYSDYLGLDTAKDPVEALRAANAGSAIGGYRDGLTIEELDDPERTTWLTNAIRNAEVLSPADGNKKYPLVLFSHGSGAYRVSYGFWTEFLASHGYVVAACDHPGSARYTIVDGDVITPGGPRSERSRMESDRPLDLIQMIDGLEEKRNKSGGKLFQTIDTNTVAVTGMSFGGFTTVATLELQDPRIKAAVAMASSMSMSGTQDYHTPARKNKSTPAMIMIGTEDSVLGTKHNDANRQYIHHHKDGDAYLLEIVRGGHVSFTSCELYNPEYGNGINAEGVSKSLTQPGSTYRPWDIVKQHEVINHYGLRFLDKYLKKKDFGDNGKKQFDPAEVIFRSNRDSSL